MNADGQGVYYDISGYYKIRSIIIIISGPISTCRSAPSCNNRSILVTTGDL
jgi:hypothetical protein